MVHGRRWGRRAALLTAAVVTVLAAPAAAHAFTVVSGTETNGWWSSDTTVQFGPTETWTLSDFHGIPVQHDIGGSLDLGALGTGTWSVASDTTPRETFDLDFTPPTSVLNVGAGDGGVTEGWYKDSAIAFLGGDDDAVNGAASGYDHGVISYPATFGTIVRDGVARNGEVEITGASGPTPVTYWTVDKAGNASLPQTTVLKIDSAPPQTHFAYTGATFNPATGWWYGGPLSILAVGTDPNESGVAAIDVCRNGLCGRYFGSTAGPFLVQNESATISAVSTDLVGHAEAPSFANTISAKDDAVPPTGNLVLTGTPGDNGWYRSPVDVTIVNAADGGSGLAADTFHYQLFGSTPTSFDGTYEVTREGDTAFTGEISDVAGNVTKLPQDVRIDTQAPNATLQGSESQGGGGWDTYAEVDALSTDDPFPGSGVASVEFWFDGLGPYRTLDQIPGYDDGSLDLPIPDGPHTLSWRVTDTAGNVTTGSKTYKVDATPPDLTCTATTPTTWPTNGSMVPVSVHVSVSDALSGPAGGYTLDQVSSNVDYFDAQAAGEASGWDTGTGDTTGEVAALPGRTYYLTYEAQDVAGNQGFCQLQVTVPGTPGPAIMAGDLTLPDGTPLQIDVRRDASGLIGGAGVGYGDRHSTGLDDVEILGHNGYVHGTLDDGAGFTLLLHDGSPDELRLIDDDGVDTGWVTPASGDLLVTQDTTPPVLTLPDSPVTADATSPAGATVSYTVTAKDDFDPSPTVACTPASGSLFPVGSTTVRCTATDASGNESHGSFTVHVAGAAEQAADLRTWIVQRQIGPGTSLAAKLHTPLQCDDLQALANEVRAQTGKKITRQDAATIAGDLARIENALGC